MRSSLLIALAIVPWLALGAQAHGRHSHHHGHRFHHVRHHHRAFRHHRYRFHAGGVQAPNRSNHDRSPRVAESRAGVYQMVTRSAIEHGLPPALAHGIVRVESGYNCAAYNRGAAGIMQVRAATARSVGISGGLRSCRTGLEAGMRYLRQAYEMARGNSAYAATLYNRGLGARPSRSGYSHSVMRMSRLGD